MKSVTLVARKLYFGVDAQQMRDSTARVLSRLDALPADRASIKLDALVEDFRISAAASRPLVAEMVLRGLLERVGERGLEYGVTEKFRSYADARIIEPLPRGSAKLLLSHLADLAWHFNRTAIRNKYEIDTLAVFGAYMNLEPELAEVAIGVTGRRRAPATHPAAGRATQALRGHEQIRDMIEEQSSYLRVQFFQSLDEIPRPFSVIFKSSN